MMTPMGQGGRMYARPRRWPRVLAVILTLALVALAGAAAWWWVTRGGQSSSRSTPQQTKTCHTPKPVTPHSIPSPQQVNVNVANGTSTGGLAIQTADALTLRRFSVVGIGNTDKPVKSGVALVRYAPAEYAGAIRLASFVPGAELMPVAKLKGGAVELWLGPDFTGLASAKQADASTVTLPTPAPKCTH